MVCECLVHIAQEDQAIGKATRKNVRHMARSVYGQEKK